MSKRVHVTRSLRLSEDEELQLLRLCKSKSKDNRLQADQKARMGAMSCAVLPYPLTATRDFVERELHAARPRSTPCNAAGRLWANATTFALSCVGGQVNLGAGSDPRVTFEYKTGRVGAIILKRFIGGKVAATEMMVPQF